MDEDVSIKAPSSLIETSIRGIYADESVNTCMGVCSGRAKYGAADSPAEGTAPTQVLF